MATAEQTAELEADVNGESFEHEVDKKVADGARSPELVEMLLDYSLPARPWEETPTAVNPFRGPMELQFWPWNRAANALIRRQDPEGALEIWSAMYLVLLSLQQQFHHRYPKGTALCNIGVALGKIKGRRQAQVKSWLLGIIEDVITDPIESTTRLSFRNALAHPGVNQMAISMWKVAVEVRFADQSITPVLPETCVEACFQPNARTPSQECLSKVNHLLETLERAYPGLPDLENNWNVLEEAWSFLDWSRGVIGG